jgi:hypothetical protein
VTTPMVLVATWRRPVRPRRRDPRPRARQSVRQRARSRRRWRGSRDCQRPLTSPACARRCVGHHGDHGDGLACCVTVGDVLVSASVDHFAAQGASTDNGWIDTGCIATDGSAVALADRKGNLDVSADTAAAGRAEPVASHPRAAASSSERDTRTATEGRVA